MQAHNLTISIPPPSKGPACDKKCPYCISAITGYIEPNLPLIARNIPKVIQLAKASVVSNVLITGKGEPTLNIYYLEDILHKFNSFPLELQTNGKFLTKNPSYITSLHKSGLDTIAISVDSIIDFSLNSFLISEIHKQDMTCRICVNVTNHIPSDFMPLLNTAKQYKVDQLLIRNIMIPDIVTGTKEAAEAMKWIQTNVDVHHYQALWDDFKANINLNTHLARVLPHGPSIYTVDGIDICFSDYCIQENNNTTDIRSLIFLEDGHVYTSWDKIPGSRLF